MGKTDDFKLKDFRFDGSEKVHLAKLKTDSDGLKEFKDEFVAKTNENMLRINELQGRLFAEGKEAVLISIQALDGAGKDSVVKHVFSCMNPQGIDVFGYKSPTPDEASHDFLWRYHKNLPARGKLCLFNRSYFEEVLVVKVHEFYKDYKMPDRAIKNGDYFEQKYEDICMWEKYLYKNGFRVVKIFLNLSKEEQQRRFLERIERPEKNWKFSANDLKERQYWDDYQKAYEDAINATSTKHAPWYVVPADQKWYTRFIVSEIMLDVLNDINPEYPEMTSEARANLEKYRSELSGQN